MKINPYIFRGYDLRGIVGEDLTPEKVEAIAKGFGTFLKRRGVTKAVVGFDCRTTSPEYAKLMIAGLNWAGLDTIDIGMELVGTFYWAQYYLDCRGGVYVTASHNPAKYNGFKLAVDFSETLVSDGIQEIRKIVETDDFEEGAKLGRNEKKDVREAYFADISKRFKFERKFKIVVDPRCSTAGVIVPDLFRRFGFEAVEVNCNIDPTFPKGTPDPTESELAKEISQNVLEEKADIGFSYDADGDRIGIVDEKGEIILNDILVSIFAIDVLAEHPGAKIMYNTLCSKVVEETIKKYGGQPFMWRTGHSFLKKKNQEVGAAFIGELSGHFFFSADFYNHDDGIYSALRILNYLSRTGRTLSEIVASLPQYISSPEIKIFCADDKKVEMIGKIAAKSRADFPAAEVIDDERAGDGVRLDLPDSMFVIRYSQNGPYITVKFEAKTKEKYNELRNYIKDLLKQYEEIDWSSDINVNKKALED